MHSKTLFLLTFLFSFLFSFTQAPDIIITNGKVFTSDTQQLYTEEVAIRGNLIIARGTTSHSVNRSEKDATLHLGTHSYITKPLTHRESFEVAQIIRNLCRDMEEK